LTLGCLKKKAKGGNTNVKKKTEEKRALTPQQVEEMYGIPVGTLANMRCQKRGPKYYPIGDMPGKRRRVLYYVDDLEFWIRRNPVLTMDSLPEEKRRG
jgi:hypothetical protein